MIFCDTFCFPTDGRNSVHLLSSEDTFVPSEVSLEGFSHVKIKTYFQSTSYRQDMQ